MISHSVAASFLADTESSFSLEPEEAKAALVKCSRWWWTWATVEGGDPVLVFHIGAGVLQPPFFPTKMARFNRYLRAKEAEEVVEEGMRLIVLQEEDMVRIVRAKFRGIYVPKF